jgi:hypothetical protein
LFVILGCLAIYLAEKPNKVSFKKLL